MMGATKEKKGPVLLDVVALLLDLPGQPLARGQVGTIVEELDEGVGRELGHRKRTASPAAAQARMIENLTNLRNGGPARSVLDGKSL